MRKIKLLLEFNKLAMFFDFELIVPYNYHDQIGEGLRKIIPQPNKNMQKGGPQLETLT